MPSNACTVAVSRLNARLADGLDVALITEVSRGLDKQLWFLEAHVQEPTGPIRDGDGRGER